ncbi:hypothetical protein BDN70DRAFT_922681 [Pholiota conissans]|uniref:F-box domain-containing protein n=1 Tax=Pholiota conissans TaxID=109636 RepID=A0A9P6CRR5_9AGAR|nr:hypothetical protein BDN70DRAFT_922681 [Pholiota conissans]
MTRQSLISGGPLDLKDDLPVITACRLVDDAIEQHEARIERETGFQLELIKELVSRHETSMKQRRVSLLALKTQHNSLIHVAMLPPEILYNIFAWVRHSDRQDYDDEAGIIRAKPSGIAWIRKVTHTCSRWRNVALNSPELWSCLSFECFPWLEGAGRDLVDAMCLEAPELDYQDSVPAYFPNLLSITFHGTRFGPLDLFSGAPADDLDYLPLDLLKDCIVQRSRSSVRINKIIFRLCRKLCCGDFEALHAVSDDTDFEWDEVLLSDPEDEYDADYGSLDEDSQEVTDGWKTVDEEEEDDDDNQDQNALEEVVGNVD